MTSFSIVIPSYNDANYLSYAIASVADQLEGADELVVVDDGSTDETRAVVAAAQRQCSDLHYIHQPNEGVAAARNRGYASARNDWVIFLDADDRLRPNTLALYRHALIEKDTSWLIGGHCWIRKSVADCRCPELPLTRQACFKQFVRRELHLGNLSNMAFARSALADTPFPPSMRVGEDFVFLALLLAQERPKLVNQVVADIERREAGSLRSSAALEDTVQTRSVVALFTHPRLPKELKAQFLPALRRRYFSVLRHARRSGDAKVYRYWHSALIASDPLTGLNLKLWLYRLRLWCSERKTTRQLA